MCRNGLQKDSEGDNDTACRHCEGQGNQEEALDKGEDDRCKCHDLIKKRCSNIASQILHGSSVTCGFTICSRLRIGQCHSAVHLSLLIREGKFRINILSIGLLAILATILLHPFCILVAMLSGTSGKQFVTLLIHPGMVSC